MSGLFRRLGSRDAKPNPDAFWSDKWGWMDEASIDDVRRGVESGTIKGEVVEPGSSIDLVTNNDTYIIIGPVSDGGSET